MRVCVSCMRVCVCAWWQERVVRVRLWVVDGVRVCVRGAGFVRACASVCACAVVMECVVCVVRVCVVHARVRVRVGAHAGCACVRVVGRRGACVGVVRVACVNVRVCLRARWLW